MRTLNLFLLAVCAGCCSTRNDQSSVGQPDDKEKYIGRTFVTAETAYLYDYGLGAPTILSTERPTDERYAFKVASGTQFVITNVKTKPGALLKSVAIVVGIASGYPSTIEKIEIFVIDLQLPSGTIRDVKMEKKWRPLGPPTFKSVSVN